MNASPVRAFLAVVVAAATVVVIAGVSVVPFLNPIWVGFEQDRFPDAPLVALAIADQSEYPAVTLLDTQCHCHADCHRQSVPKRTCGSFYPWHLVAVGM